MKLTIDPIKCGLRERVTFAAFEISPRTTLEVLRFMKMDCFDGIIELSSTNLDQTTIARFYNDLEVDGVLLTPPFVLRDAAARGQVFTLDSKGGEEIVLTSDYSELTAYTFTPDQYPTTAKISGKNRLTLDAGKLIAALRAATPFISYDDSRYALCGVLIEVKDEIVCVVATDGRRIFFNEVGATKSADARFTIPTSAVKLFVEMPTMVSSSVETKVKISWDDNVARFDCGDYSLVTKLIGPNYPKWRQVVPAEPFKTRLVVETDELARAVRFAASCAMETNQSKPGVAFDLNSKSLTMSSAETTVGRSQSSFAAEKTGRDLKITFQPTYLLDVAESLGGGTLTLDFTGEHDQVKITGVGTAVIMPMRI